MKDPIVIVFAPMKVEIEEHHTSSVDHKDISGCLFCVSKQNLISVTQKCKPANGLVCSLNQGKNLITFLEYREFPIDNNATKPAIRPFCIGGKNCVMIDTNFFENLLPYPNKLPQNAESKFKTNASLRSSKSSNHTDYGSFTIISQTIPYFSNIINLLDLR